MTTATTQDRLVRLADVPLQACPKCGQQASQMVPVRDAVGLLIGIRFTHFLGDQDRPHVWTDASCAGALLEGAAMIVDEPPAPKTPARPSGRRPPGPNPSAATPPGPPSPPPESPAPPEPERVVTRRRFALLKAAHESIALANGGRLLLDVIADPWDLPPGEFAFVQQILRLCREFRAVHPEPAP